MRNTRLATLLLAALLAGCWGSTPPPVPLGPQSGSRVLTRGELEQQLADYETALSGQLDDGERDRITVEAEEIRQRLQHGDFRVGDRITVAVQGETLADTVTVEPGLTVDFGLFGQTSVEGVLRAEIQDHLTQALSSYIRDPVVRANALMRISIIGAVGQPGFYTMPAETVLGDALMMAGGPGGGANLDEVRVRRGLDEIMEGEEVRQALQAGLTLDQLNLAAGDQIVVPERRGFLQLLGIITTVVGSVSFLFWLFI